MLINIERVFKCCSQQLSLSSLVAFFLALTCLSAYAAQSAVHSAESTKHAELAAEPATTPAEVSLPEIARQTMAVHFGERNIGNKTLEQFADEMPVRSQFRKPAGLFVTLSYKGKTRACWGSVYPEEDTIAKSTVYSTISALTKEYRYPPVRRSEWKRLKAQVTVIKGIEPISSISFQNPLRDGLLVRSGGRGGVILPGEAVDAHYQLVLCKLKAGIKSGEPCQLYRLRTDIYD